MNDLIDKLTWHDLINKLKVILKGLVSSSGAQVVTTSSTTYTIAPTSSTVFVIYNGAPAADFYLPSPANYTGTELTVTCQSTNSVALHTSDGSNVIWDNGMTENSTWVYQNKSKILFSDGTYWRLLIST